MKHEESKIQISFMEWFKLQHNNFYQFLFHVPNGGKIGVVRGTILKKMGVKRGVADVLFMFPNETDSGLWLEFKTAKGKQTKEQKQFENICHVAKFDYQVVFSLEEAILAINRYMGKLTKQKKIFPSLVDGLILKKPLSKNFGKLK